MKEALQDLRTGVTIVEVVPDSIVSAHTFLIEQSASIISEWNDRTIVEFSNMGCIEQTRQ
jgi:hypothetical protein